MGGRGLKRGIPCVLAFSFTVTLSTRKLRIRPLKMVDLINNLLWKTRAVDPHSFFAGPDLDPAVLLNADPDPAA